MAISRRIILGVGAIVVVGGAAGLLYRSASSEVAVTPLAPPPNGDPRLTERSIGRADAKVTVHEFYSLTCPHCASFHKESMPEIRKELIDTGRIRMVFHDFPLDKLALTAAVIARYLPAERYEPFIGALLSSQERWIYARPPSTPTDEIWKLAALAGLSRANFDAALADQATSNALLAMQDKDAKTYQIDSTPSFIFQGPKVASRRESGARSYADFAKLVAEAGG
jgi:protein-disulfide isomerase